MGASNRLVAEVKVGLESFIPRLLVRVRSDMVTMGCKWWALAMMGLDIPMVRILLLPAQVRHGQVVRLLTLLTFFKNYENGQI